jgi:hypothetical protein
MSGKDVWRVSREAISTATEAVVQPARQPTKREEEIPSAGPSCLVNAVVAQFSLV